MSLICTLENRERVAEAFLAVLDRWFAGNSKGYPKTVTKRMVLDANDYWDANMAMDEAFKKCGIAVFTNGEMSDEVCKLWDWAWERAADLAAIRAREAS